MVCNVYLFVFDFVFYLCELMYLFISLYMSVYKSLKQKPSIQFGCDQKIEQRKHGKKSKFKKNLYLGLSLYEAG